MNEAGISSSAAKQSFRTLVTGANGFTGRYLVEKLTGRGHTVIEAVSGRAEPDTPTRVGLGTCRGGVRSA
ncbi:MULTISPECIES: NAD-dependent epimerase/dehydratase family protein [unclassified Paraburkholderia]|uniref:NAD-dependent epimerase/dehydratase family protein n=1 Tax=unclassified Paraburkholderia TaxID=2615204 RepID=UPI001805B7CA|nr:MULTISPECIES: NAD-dependent epimerase/dehydratase family protein [unclassified Paraburkholderia]MBB5445159.1 nucleoside-diphosphate-sugar epimerase [Paraburkholderia sp. WSM4177]MBB5485707.1 nucleoside-diphosphate-sugar epimerase [Paraburkholderia sp. WSM4180]